MRGVFVFHRTRLHKSQLDQSKSSESAVSANSFGEFFKPCFTISPQNRYVHKRLSGLLEILIHPFKPLTEGVSLYTYSSTLNENGHESRSRPTGRLRGLDSLRKRPAVAVYSRSNDPKQVAVYRLHHI